jgi:hypothetical protein
MPDIRRETSKGPCSDPASSGRTNSMIGTKCADASRSLAVSGTGIELATTAASRPRDPQAATSLPFSRNSIHSCARSGVNQRGAARSLSLSAAPTAGLPLERSAQPPVPADSSQRRAAWIGDAARTPPALRERATPSHATAVATSVAVPRIAASRGASRDHSGSACSSGRIQPRSRSSKPMPNGEMSAGVRPNVQVSARVQAATATPSKHGPTTGHGAANTTRMNQLTTACIRNTNPSAGSRRATTICQVGSGSR